MKRIKSSHFSFNFSAFIQQPIYPFFPLSPCSRSSLFIYSSYNPRVMRIAYVRVQVVYPLLSLADKALETLL